MNVKKIINREREQARRDNAKGGTLLAGAGRSGIHRDKSAKAKVNERVEIRNLTMEATSYGDIFDWI